MRRPKAGQSKIAIFAVIAATILGVGVVVGSLLLPTKMPASLAAGQEPTEVPVTKVATDDRQSVNLGLSSAEPQKLVARGAGIVTSTACRPGEEAVSGTTAFSLNDQPLIYIATSRPIWRDLGIGDRGPDVEAFQTELSRLGHSVAVDGKFGRSTLKAAIAMARHAGDDSARSWTAFPAASIVWLPAGSVTVDTCDASLGAEVAAGTRLATLPPVLASAAVKPLPTQVMTGDRVIVAGDLTLPVDADGTVSDPADLTALGRSSAYRAFMEGRAGAGPSPGGSVIQGPESAGTSGSAMSVDYRLAAPLEVFSVPAAAVYNVNGTEACVLSKGSGVAVMIADSQLGQTLVVPASGKALRSVSLDHKSAPACR